MAAWLPILKTVLPYLTTIVTAAVPAFNARKDNEQIAELQQAVRHNAESIKVLAEQMQRTIQAIEAGVMSSERAVRRARLVSVLSLVVAAVSLGVALVIVWGR
jgi:hypothetical protein